jgi:hypothetical protein
VREEERAVDENFASGIESASELLGDGVSDELDAENELSTSQLADEL